ncbi:WcbI family polysaccharide biosynthesis putative acetyltransferase [Rhodococcoides corynebacterioides]|uniref:WcbI family polysaccharide biosynthesis putative acetyltransferase n=1 Tax=Rhodococcoides corynebacterioides TaxID=53972 RepID=UPI003F7F2BBD
MATPARPGSSTGDPPDARTRHYGHFYGIDDIPTDRPLWIVLGNCQAEALRVVLDTVADAPFTSVRMPPVHELTESDVAHLEALATHAQVLLAQPVRSGYRDLPIGTDDVAAHLPSGARVLRWPVFRYAGLFPFQAIVRDPADPSRDPPVVPYHDLRTVRAAALGLSETDDWDVPIDDETVRWIADRSLAELRRRESAACDVTISDAVPGYGAAAAHTINHPGNPVLIELATRILRALDVPATPADPGRTLLDSVHTPFDPRVLSVLDPEAPPALDWTVHGETRSADEVHRAQLRWYAEHPAVIDAAVDRHDDVLARLGATR